MRTPLLLAAFFFTPAAQAAMDLSKVPTVFCTDAEILLWDSQKGCADNHKLSDGAEACFKKLESLERALGADAMAVANSGQKSQLSQVNTGNREYAFSDQAFAYLMATAKLAQNELEPFPAYLMAPEGYYEPEVTGSLDPDEYARRLDCHGGIERRLALVQKNLAAKIARFEARQLEARNYQKALNGDATEFGSLSEGAAHGVNQDKLPVGQRHVAGKPSNITGIEKDREKRAQSQNQR